MRSIRTALAVILVLSSMPVHAEPDPSSHDDQDLPWETFERFYLRDFAIAGCSGTAELCRTKQLALPLPGENEQRSCLKDVLPTVGYIRDGQKAMLGMSFVLTARLMPRGIKKNALASLAIRSKKMTAVVLVRDPGVQDICVPTFVTVDDRRFRLQVDNALTAGTKIIGDIREQKPELDETALIMPTDYGVAHFSNLIGGGSTLSALTETAIEAIFGSSANDMVSISILSQSGQADIMMDNQVVGRTDLIKAMVAVRALTRVRVKIANRWKALITCDKTGLIGRSASLRFMC